jgi:hypothetical protein
VVARARCFGGSLAIAATLCALAPALASAKLPRGFYGVASQEAPTPADLDAMRAGNVGTLRFAVHWGEIEPAPGRFHWSQLDAVVAGAAASGVRLLPFTYGSPWWLGGGAREAPIENRAQRHAWTRFHKELARRYGRGGSFWAGRSERAPITRWQPWNEPNLRYYWGRRPSARGYARLLSLASSAIRGQDSGARIMLAGLAPGRGQAPWEFLRDLYRVPRIERRFDVVAVHPYAHRLAEVEHMLERVRATISLAGDRSTPIEVTELGWASGGPSGYALVRSPKGQARMLTRSFRLLRKNRRRWRLRGAQWFSWADRESTDRGCLWCEHAGLFTLDRRPKPAWAAFEAFTTPRRRRSGEIDLATEGGSTHEP